MKISEIKNGAIYETRAGFHRKVLSMPYYEVEFICLDGPQKGRQDTIHIQSFAKWARSEVKENKL